MHETIFIVCSLSLYASTSISVTEITPCIQERPSQFANVKCDLINNNSIVTQNIVYCRDIERKLNEETKIFIYNTFTSCNIQTKTLDEVYNMI